MNHKSSSNGNGSRAAYQRNRERARGERRSRLVDFLEVREDYECAHFGALGFSSKFINEQTGLSTGQIQYRLKKAKLSRMEFRNGHSVYAHLVMRNMRQVTQEKLVRHLYSITPPPIRQADKVAA